MNIGANIRRARAKHRLTTRELSARAGVDADVIRAIESGTLIPGSSVIIALARALNVSVECLLFGKEGVYGKRHRR